YELIPAAYQFQRPVTFQIAIATPILTAPANRIGMYVYNPDSGVWDRLPSQMSVMTDTTTGITADLFTYAALTTVPNFDGFYALYADTVAPAVPILNALPATTSRRSVLVSGRADPLSTVSIYISSGPVISTNTARVAFPTNPQGLFAGDLTFPSP